jgi:hypothetical protein
MLRKRMLVGPQDTMLVKGEVMRTILAVTVLFLLSAAQAESQEVAKIKVAVVRLDRLMNAESGGYERLRLLLADKDIIEGLKKINAEIKAMQKELLGVEDEIKLAEMGKRIEFLNRKSGLLRQRMYNDSGRDMQKLVREFVVKNYKDQYHLIAQDPGVFDRFIYKDNAEISDITEEAVAKFKDYLDKATGE